MKTWQNLSPASRKAIIAAILIAAFEPAPISLALRYASILAVIAAALLILRIHPAGTHKTLTAVRIPRTIASLVTGHTPPAPKPEPSYKHAPAGPQIPVTNHTR